MTLIEKINVTLGFFRKKKDSYTAALLQRFLNRVQSHRYGVDLGDLPYDKLTFTFVKGNIVWGWELSDLPEDFEVLANTEISDGHTGLFTASEKGVKVSKAVFEATQPRGFLIPVKGFQEDRQELGFALNSLLSVEKPTRKSKPVQEYLKKVSRKKR